jgi:hypothetical protein
MPSSVIDGKVNLASGYEPGAEALAGACSQLVNWEVDDAGANVPRASMAPLAMTGIGSGAINGLFYWAPYVIVTYEDGTWQKISDTLPDTAQNIYDSTATTQLLGGLRPTFVGGDVFVYAAAGEKIRYYGPGFSPDVAATLTNSPRCSHIASLGSYLIANDIDDPGSWVWSDIGEGSWGTWPAANGTSSQARPDPVVGIFDSLTELYVFGSETLQVYQVGNDPTLPFDLVASVETGIGAPYAFCRLDSQISYMDHRRTIRIGDGRTSEEISGPIRSDLRAMATVSDCFCYREEVGQRAMLVYRFPTEGKTFVYDLDRKTWTTRMYYASPFQDDYRVGAYCYWNGPTTTRHLVGLNVSGGGLATLGTSGASTDLAAPVVCERTTGWHDHGSASYKRSRRMRLTLRRGIGAASGDIGALEVRVQDDDKPWSAWENVSIGRPDEYENTVDLAMGGVFRRRRYGFRWSNTERASLAMAYDVCEELDR